VSVSQQKKRTVLSAYNFLNGLFGDASEVVSLHLADSDADETTGGNSKLCPVLSKLYAKIYNSTDFSNYYNSKLGGVVQR
jgi:hypothetical protein